MKPNLNKLIDKAKAASTVLMLLLSTTAGFAGGWLGSNSREAVITGEPEASKQVILDESQLINEIAEAASKSVVSIDVIGSTPVTGGFFGYFGGFETAGAGTGIVVSEDGYIMTNRHVVPKGTTSVAVTLSDGTRFEEVSVVGRTREGDPLDIAFLKIKDLDGKKLTAAKIGNSQDLKIGDKVIAIGNALGQFQNTVTSGIISGFGRSVVTGDQYSSESLQNLLQTDAAINEGNSGGPLVNMHGEVIGVNTAIAGSGAQNIGFSLPIDDIKPVLAGVLEKGVVERPYLGVRYVTITEAYAKQLELGATSGAYIVPGERGSKSILPDSPAAKAGLKEEDIITKVGDKTVDEKNGLSSLVGRHRVGEKVTLTVLRGSEELKIEVTLEATP